MGVTGLWTVLQPCARPIKLETLNKKRLAVDASIWIYQFLKAVRDKEGNALRNSHVVGFFRRICKLLFFGIKPVFVFDGGAPALKRQTISGRKARREGRREDAVRTAGKLLAVQMQRRAEEEDRRRREERNRPARDEHEEEIPENLVYAEEIQMTEKERLQNRKFKKKDAYHLPELDVSITEMGAPNDPRIMSHEELEEYARQFHRGEAVNLYDFSKIDFNGSFFQSLPASDQYNILNAARLRSRLRMGYSKEQLDTMFPDRMAFSKFQVERVSERNELTQRLMNLNGMNGENLFGADGGGRVAGEKGKEYVLVKNDGVEGGWALGVVSNRNEGERNKPIDVERLGKVQLADDNDDDELEDEGFEDVPIEGLNRLPKGTTADTAFNSNAGYASSEAIERRKKLYKERRKNVSSTRDMPEEMIDEDPESLFLPQNLKTTDDMDEGTDELFEDVLPPLSEEDEELQMAIAMSLEEPEQAWASQEADTAQFAAMLNGPRIDQPLEFNQRNAKAGRAFAHITNAKAIGAVPGTFINDDDDNHFDFQATLADSMQRKQQPYGRSSSSVLPTILTPQSPRLGTYSGDTNPTATSPAPNAPSLAVSFAGPLPFESINLGKFMLKKKQKQPLAEEEGGFQKEPPSTEKPAQPLPPWFSEDVVKATAAQKALEDRQFDGGNPDYRPRHEDDVPVLKRQRTGEVIDVEAFKANHGKEIEVISSSEDERPSEDEHDEVIGVEEAGDVVMEDVTVAGSGFGVGDVADSTRRQPTLSEITSSAGLPLDAVTESVQEEEAEGEPEISDDPDSIEWEESDLENNDSRQTEIRDLSGPASGELNKVSSKSTSPEFENVNLANTEMDLQSSAVIPNAENPTPNLEPMDTFDHALEEAVAPDDDDMYSDPEDEDLLRQLAVEAEEHARFASTLNAKSQLQSAEDYERELRQLRNQQKKDRRDADEVSHIMVTECQQLLKLFGIPYITAPMEAEAQCAELVTLGLVDGIVTDDSDIFLFGGTRVYKNMFNQAKFVECYLSSDLEKEYSLTRTKIIQIAHLLGSDYTEGLPSIGPVTALEILSEFPDLEAFKEWWEQVQRGEKHPTDSTSPFRRKFKRNATKLFLPPIFPDKRVDHAYLHPEIDSDPSPFAWGVPDLDSLRQFLMATIGWTQERADEILVPVIRDMNRRENEGTQANITRFFEGAVGVGARESDKTNSFAPRRRGEGKSKRMANALGKLHERATQKTREGDVELAEGENSHTGHENGGKGPEAEEQVRASRKKPGKRLPRPLSDDGQSGDDGQYEEPLKGKKRRKGLGKKG